MVQSARGSRRSCSVSELRTCEEKVDVCNTRLTDRRRTTTESNVEHKSKTRADADNIWIDRPARTDGSYEDQFLFSTAPQRSARKQSAKLQGEPCDDAMDALDGLLASLDEERDKQAESPRSPSVSPPRPKTAPDPQRKCGIGPVPNKPAATGKLWIPTYNTATYDDEVIVDSPHSSFEIDGSPASVYCPLSPTLMSVHLPGSPIPKAIDLDDTTSSVVFIEPRKPENYGVRPCRVRFECRGDDANKHAPQAPTRKRFGTGKIASRPLGCTMVQANFGGA